MKLQKAEIREHSRFLYIRLTVRKYKIFQLFTSDKYFILESCTNKNIAKHKKKSRSKPVNNTEVAIQHERQTRPIRNVKLTSLESATGILLK